MTTCQRCGNGNAVYVVFSRVLLLAVCRRCAEVADALPHGEPGRVYVGPMELLSEKDAGNNDTTFKKTDEERRFGG
jgi:hypothetical protein